MDKVRLDVDHALSQKRGAVPYILHPLDIPPSATKFCRVGTQAQHRLLIGLGVYLRRKPEELTTKTQDAHEDTAPPYQTAVTRGYYLLVNQEGDTQATSARIPMELLDIGR